MITKKQIEYFSAVTEFLTVFAHENLGYMPEVNTEYLMNYLNSNRFFTKSLLCELSTKEQALKSLEEDILSGFPVWRMLILSDWTMKILDREFENSLEEEERELKAKFLCYTCKYYKLTNTSFGSIEECNYVSEYRSNRIPSGRSRGPFEPVEECDKYKRIEK